MPNGQFTKEAALSRRHIIAPSVPCVPSVPHASEQKNHANNVCTRMSSPDVQTALGKVITMVKKVVQSVSVVHNSVASTDLDVTQIALQYHLSL